jgi:hypothetical protein
VRAPADSIVDSWILPLTTIQQNHGADPPFIRLANGLARALGAAGRKSARAVGELQVR